jgi:galactitol-specific phosphotransferase system IIB component
MGIEQFFNSLARNNNVKNNGGIITSVDKKIICDYFYVDFNSVVYTVFGNLEHDLNHLLYAIILGNSHVLTDEVKAIAAEWNYSLTTLSVDTYKSHFSSELIDTMAIQKIREYVRSLVSNVVDNSVLKKIYIAIDGVPQMSKVIEQKRRKYMGYIGSELHKSVVNKFEGMIPIERQLFEQHKISCDRGKIISWTTFMTNIGIMLTSTEFTEEIKLLCPLLAQYAVSTQNMAGEGEKKIVEEIMLEKMAGTYGIFSPDADVVILGMLMENMLESYGIDTRFNIIRYNQQAEAIDVADIRVLSNNIYDYVKKIYFRKNLQNMANTILDVAFVFTLFGNDFVPRMESINPKSDVETLIYAYCSCVSDKYPRLVYEKPSSLPARILYDVNYINLANFISFLAHDEASLLRESYMSRNYKNYGYLKSVFNTFRNSDGKVINALQEYAYQANTIIAHETMLSKMCGGNVDMIDLEVKKFIETIDVGMLKQYYIIEGNNQMDSITKLNINEFKDVVINFIKSRIIKNKSYARLKLVTFDHDVKSQYHQTNINQSKCHESIVTTELDEQLYSVDKMLGQWRPLLNGTDYNLGQVTLSKKINENGVARYKIFQRNIKDEVIEYYKEFFTADINLMFPEEVITLERMGKNGREVKQVRRIKSEIINNVVEEYLRGLFWTFEFYFNKNDFHENLQYVSKWYYPFTRAPLLTQINDMLSVYEFDPTELIRYMGNIRMSLHSKGSHVKREHYLNKLEHYMYVTPKNKHKDIDPSYTAMYDKNDIFPDMHNIAQVITSGSPDISKVIDSRRVQFLNKCHLITIENIPFDKYISGFYPLRKDNADNPSVTDTSFRLMWQTGGDKPAQYNL